MFKELKSYFAWAKADLDKVMKRDGVMILHNVPVNPRRTEFFKDLNSISMDKIEKKYLNCSIPKRLIAQSKPLLYKIGVFKLYMLVKRMLMDKEIIGRM